MKKVMFIGFVVLILATAVIAQSTTGNQSTTPSKQSDQQKLKDFNRNAKAYEQQDNRVKAIDSQLKNPALTPQERTRLEIEKKVFEEQKDSIYDALQDSRNNVMHIAKDPATSAKMLDNAKLNVATAESKRQANPADPAAQIEYAKAVQELALATEFDKQVNSNSQACPSAWACIGGLLTAYDQYKGIGQITHLAWPEYSEWSKNLRQQISQTFCGFVSIQNCFESLICGAVLDISAGDSISGNVLFGRGSNGQPLTAGTISAERSMPIVLKGLDRELLIDIIGTEIALIDNQIVNLSEIDTATLPAQEARLYKIQYAITNIHQDRDLSYNIEVKGKTTRKVFSIDKKLKPGETGKKTIEAYKTTKYDEVCMTFNPSLPAGTGSTLLVAPKMVSKLCKPIVEYAGGATSIGNYAKEEKENTQTGGTPGGSW